MRCVARFLAAQQHWCRRPAKSATYSTLCIPCCSGPGLATSRELGFLLRCQLPDPFRQVARLAVDRLARVDRDAIHLVLQQCAASISLRSGVSRHELRVMTNHLHLRMPSLEIRCCRMRFQKS
jgi:hypothetical protein